MSSACSPLSKALQQPVNVAMEARHPLSWGRDCQCPAALWEAMVAGLSRILSPCTRACQRKLLLTGGLLCARSVMLALTFTGACQALHQLAPHPMECRKSVHAVELMHCYAMKRAWHAGSPGRVILSTL